MLLSDNSQPGGKERRGLSLNTCFSLSKVRSKNILVPWRICCLCISSPFRPRLPSLEGKLREIFLQRTEKHKIHAVLHLGFMLSFSLVFISVQWNYG